MEWRNQVAVVTGGSLGIGRATPSRRADTDALRYFQRGRIPTRKGISPGSPERIVDTARSIARRPYAPDRNLWNGVHHIPDASGVLGCAPGAGAQGRRRRHRVGATDIQQRMPDLPYD